LWFLGAPKQGSGFRVVPSDEHYVVVIGDQVFDPTARRFDQDSDPIKRSALEDIKAPWHTAPPVCIGRLEPLIGRACMKSRKTGASSRMSTRPATRSVGSTLDPGRTGVVSSPDGSETCLWVVFACAQRLQWITSITPSFSARTARPRSCDSLARATVSPRGRGRGEHADHCITATALYVESGAAGAVMRWLGAPSLSPARVS
jgi:hypothetical protein